MSEKVNADELPSRILIDADVLFSYLVSDANLPLVTSDRFILQNQQNLGITALDLRKV